MKLNDFLNFRIYNKRGEYYVEPVLEWHNLNNGMTSLSIDLETLENNQAEINFDEENYLIESYIGLMDKNGNKIYKGDIVYYLEGFFEIISVNSGGYALKPISYNGSILFPIFKELENYVEIRGNVNKDYEYYMELFKRLKEEK